MRVISTSVISTKRDSTSQIGQETAFMYLDSLLALRLRFVCLSFVVFHTFLRFTRVLSSWDEKL